MKHILFVASECSPFIKTGGLADVTGSLPQALQTYENMHVSVILPLYDEIAQEWKDQMVFKAIIRLSLDGEIKQPSYIPFTMKVFTIISLRIRFITREKVYMVILMMVSGFYFSVKLLSPHFIISTLSQIFSTPMIGKPE